MSRMINRCCWIIRDRIANSVSEVYMKVWETSRKEVILKKDTGKFALHDCMEDATASEVTSEYIQKVIDDEWPDNTITWKRHAQRCSGLCDSSAEDWQCGAFGPDGRFCKRLEHHRGDCSDLFLPEDRKNVTKRLTELRQNELGEILGRPVRTATSRKYNMDKLRKILKDEE